VDTHHRISYTAPACVGTVRPTSQQQVTQFLGWAADCFDVRHIQRSIPEEWRVPDVTVVMLHPTQRQPQEEEEETEMTQEGGAMAATPEPRRDAGAQPWQQ
jgi:hypothetical protein